MKISNLILSILLALTITKANSQVFSYGDISVMLQPSGYHDSTQCATQGQMFYYITINNSFIGDSVKVKEMSSGTMIYEERNITGQTPWTINVPVYNAFGFISDDQLVYGYASYNGPINKVISGTDTVFNITNFYQLPVTNPCQYSNISGRIYVDYNNDCIFNGNDVALNAIGVTTSEILNSPSMSGINLNGYSDINGNYNINALQSWMTNYSVFIPSYYQFIFPSTNCSPIVYNYNSLPQSNVDFSLQCTSLLDVQCYAGSQGWVRPNVGFILNPYVSNTGCNMASGVLKLILDPNVIYNASLSTNTPSSISGDTLIWNYTNLTNLTNGGYWNSFVSGIHLTPNTSITIGSSLCFRIFTEVLAGDIDATNNDYTICIPVVNSFDPNAKEVFPKGDGAAGYIPFNTPDLTYTIHFQNTGTAQAYNVSIIDTLDSDLDVNSLLILGTSHYATPQWIAPGVVKFNFFNIYLPDSGSSQSASNGFIRFKVKLKASLPFGTSIRNKARIYFDYNPAVVTNSVINTLNNINEINENLKNGLCVSVYPNPMRDNANFVVKSNILNDMFSLELIDILGNKVISKKEFNNKEFTLSRNGLINGIYFYKIYNINGILGVGKLVVE